MDPAFNKAAQEVERHVLKTTIKLSDGTSGQVFTRNAPKDNTNVFSYNCHLCGVPNLLGERCLQTHIAGRKHQVKLTMPIVDAATFRAPLIKKAQISMAIAPGEPVPPGFENEVKAISELQSKIDKIRDQALLGLEYIMELAMGNKQEPNYHCVICDKRGDPRTIIVHITSYNHRLKYLEKHFPTCIRELAPFRFNKDARDIMPKVLQSICEAIEDTHGRLTPNVYDNNNYMKNRMRYLQDAINDRHFDEKMGSSFINVIDRKAIQDAIKNGESVAIKTRTVEPSPPRVPPPKRGRSDRKSLDSVSSISSISSVEKSPQRSTTTRRVVGTIDLRSQSRSISPAVRRRRTKSKSPSLKNSTSSRDNRQIAPTPRELSIQSSQIAHERYKWEKYRCMVELALPEIEKSYKEHEKNPEKHPMYPEEWKKFWNKRYKELQNEKKDPSKHDFKPEWIIFWTKRMKELQESDIEKRKMEIRKKLNLPEDGKERTDELKEQFTMKVKPIEQLRTQERVKSSERLRSSEPQKSLDRKKSKDRDGSSERSSKKSEERESYRRRERERERQRKRSPSPRKRSISPARKRSISPDDSYSRRRRRSRSPDSYSREMPPTASHHRVYVPPPNHHYRYEHPQRYDEWGRPIYYGPPPVKGPPFFYKDGSGYPPPTQSPPSKYEEEDTAPLTVVSVLRLLTALEELLGSLGPKVNDLLAKALALEKVKANSADDMLINEDNCVIFETIKEKLKGQLIAGVLDKNKINAVKKAIKNVAAIIHQVNEKAKNQPKEESPKIETASSMSATEIAQPVSATNSSESIDKAAIAQKLASALILQGKTDVTSEQLEQLINVYFAMQQKAKESNNKTITTATYLEEIKPKSVETSNQSPVIASGSPSVVAATVSAIDEEPEVTLDEESPMYDNDESEKNTFDNSLPADASSALESLTDSDLQTLLQNFKDLSAEEQQHLIAYLKKLEASEPARVEKLRKFVKADDTKETNNSEKIFDDDDDDNDNEPVENIFEDDQPPEKIIIPTKDKIAAAAAAKTASTTNTTTSSSMQQDKFKSYEKPIASSSTIINKNAGTRATLYSDDDEDTSFNKRFIDSDDDDEYSYDEVFRAASKNVKEKQMQEEAAAAALLQQEKNRDDDTSNISRPSSTGSTSTQNLNMSIADTQNLIANLMGSLQKNAQTQNKSSFGTNIISPVPNNSHTLQESMLQPPPLVLPQKSISSMNSASSSMNPITAPLPPLPNTAPTAATSSTSVPFYQQQSTFYQETGAYGGGGGSKNTNSYSGYIDNGQMASNYYQNYAQMQQGYNNQTGMYDSTMQQAYAGMYGNTAYPPPVTNQLQMQTNYQNYAQQTGMPLNTQMQQQHAVLQQQQQALMQQNQQQSLLQQNQQQQSVLQQNQQQQSVLQQNQQQNNSQQQVSRKNNNQQTRSQNQQQQQSSQQRSMIPHQVQQKQQSRQGQQQQNQQQQQQQQQRYPANNNNSMQQQQYNNYY